MNEAFHALLLRARETDSPVAIYTSPENPRAFLVGWVEAVTLEHVVLRHLSPEGRYDGYVLRPFDNIFRIDSEGRYIERLSYLFNARRQSFPGPLIATHDEEANLVSEILQGAKSQDLLVSIEIAADDLESGAVKDVGFDTVTLEVLDYYGAMDREATVHLAAISEVRVDSERLQSLRLMSNWHQMPGLE